MRRTKKERLEKKGWKVGTVEEFLDLSPDESAYIEMKLRLSESLRQRRKRRRLSQVELAKLIKSSQSRVAKMEGGDPSVLKPRIGQGDLLLPPFFIKLTSWRSAAAQRAFRCIAMLACLIRTSGPSFSEENHRPCRAGVEPPSRYRISGTARSFPRPFRHWLGRSSL